MSRYRYDAIVFDFDGTLVESNELKSWAFGKLYEDHGEDIVKQVIAYHHENLGVSRFIKFRHWHEQLLCEPYTKEIEEALVKSFSSLVLDAMVVAPYIKGAKEFLETFHQRLPLFVASGTPEKELREIIQKRKMTQYFYKIFGSPSSKVEIIKSIIRQYHFPLQKVLLVGDSILDLEAANSVGTAFLGVQLQGQYSNLPDGEIINSLYQLEKYI